MHPDIGLAGRVAVDGGFRKQFVENARHRRTGSWGIVECVTEPIDVLRSSDVPATCLAESISTATEGNDPTLVTSSSSKEARCGDSGLGSAARPGKPAVGEAGSETQLSQGTLARRKFVVRAPTVVAARDVEPPDGRQGSLVNRSLDRSSRFRVKALSQPSGLAAARKGGLNMQSATDTAVGRVSRTGDYVVPPETAPHHDRGGMPSSHGDSPAAAVQLKSSGGDGGGMDQVCGAADTCTALLAALTSSHPPSASPGARSVNSQALLLHFLEARRDALISDNALLLEQNRWLRATVEEARSCEVEAPPATRTAP